MSLSFREAAKRVDPVDPPQFFRGSATDEDLDWYKVKPGTDATELKGAIRGCTYEPIGLVRHAKKGLAQLHRWSPSQQRAGNNLSLRNVLERHNNPDSTVRKLLFYNAWLIDPPLGIAAPPERDDRMVEIGKAINAAGYDIIGLCEVFRKQRGRAIEAELTFPFESERGPGPAGLEISSGLHTIVKKPGCRVTDDGRKSFAVNDGWWDHLSQKGMLYVEIDLGPGKIDFFTTHFNAVDETSRRHQVDELVEFVHEHNKVENVTVVAGDFNIDGRKDEYTRFLLKMFGPKLQDIWLTRGGRLGATHKIDEYSKICKLDSVDNFYCDVDNTSGSPGTPSDKIPGYRLDYIFVEEPKDSHSFNLDLTRVRRCPFWRGLVRRGNFPVDHFLDDETPPYMSDHLGLEVTLIASPK